MRKKRKRHFNIVKFVLFIFIIYIMGYFIYHLFIMPIRHISILNTNYLDDQTILRLAKIDDYPSFLLTTSSGIKKKLKSNPYIEDVKVEKKWFCQIYIYVTEYKPLFYDVSSAKLVLSNENKISYEKDISIPKLINYVPDTVYDKFIDKMNLISHDVLNKISEIEYAPNEVDKERFLMTMNDGNYVYLTLYTFDKINNYNKIFALLGGKRGIVNLDYGNYGEIID